MSNRCPNCNKFVSLEAQEPEIETLEVDDEGVVEAEARLVLTCVECGEEMKETRFEFSAPPPGIEEHIEQHTQDGEEYHLTVEETGLDTGDRFATIDKKGRPIKKMRYQKHFYTVEVEAEVTCSCNKTFSIGFEDECQASAFDELV